MKKITLILTIILALCMLVSCGGAKDDPAVTEPKPEKIDLSSFSICAATDIGAEVNTEVIALRDKLNSAYGIQMVVGDDFVIPGEEIPADTNEILIGKTNRAQSESLFTGNERAHDFKISYDGQRIAVAGTTDESTAEAVRYLISLVEADGLYLKVGYEYSYKYDYACPDATVNGNSLNMYTIVYKDSDIAKDVAEKIALCVGYSLDVVAEKKAPADNIIWVGSETELGVDFLNDDYGYGVMVDGGNMYVSYTYPKSAVRADDALADAFAETAALADGYTLARQEDCVRIVMLGDSNTAGAKLQHWFETYLTTRFPNKTFEVINSGIGGDSPLSGLERINWDVLNHLPDVVIVNFGCNGVVETIGALDGKVSESARDSKVKSFLDGMENIVKKLITYDIEVVLATPVAYDEWMDSSEENYKNAYIGFEMMSDGVKELAEKYSLECVDYFSNLMVILKDYREEKGALTAKTIFSDRKHMDLAGALAAGLAYAEDHSEWGSDLVTAVELSAGVTEATAENAEVKVITSSPTYIYYTYKPNAIPLPDNEYYAKLEGYGKTDLAAYNRELLKVTGLEAGSYEVRYNGALVVTRTAEELAEGINLADITRNPTQKLAKEVFTAMKGKIDNVATFRSFSYIETRYIRPNGLAALTVDERVANFAEQLEKKTVSGYIVSCMESYINTASKFEKMEKEIDYAEYKSQRLALVDPYRVEIVKVD